MGKTAMSAGRVIAVYVDDGQGRRIVLGSPREGSSVILDPLPVATHRGELDALVRALRELRDELPEAPTTRAT